jgi:hypothetical protein
VLDAIVLAAYIAFSLWSAATDQSVLPGRQVLALGRILSTDGTDLLADYETWRKAEPLVRESDRTTMFVVLARPDQDASSRKAKPHGSSRLVQLSVHRAFVFRVLQPIESRPQETECFTCVGVGD